MNLQNIYDTLTSPQSLVSVVYADMGRSVPRKTEREREWRDRERTIIRAAAKQPHHKKACVGLALQRSSQSIPNQKELINEEPDVL